MKDASFEDWEIKDYIHRKMRAFPSLYLFKVLSDIFKTVKKILYDNQSHFDQFLAEKQMKLHLLKGKKLVNC